MIEHTFSQFLSATIGPVVARVSAPSTIPSLNRQPTMVVPILVAFGRGSPRVSRNALLDYELKFLDQRADRFVLLKSKPGRRYTEFTAVNRKNRE